MNYQNGAVTIKPVMSQISAPHCIQVGYNPISWKHWKLWV